MFSACPLSGPLLFQLAMTKNCSDALLAFEAGDPWSRPLHLLGRLGGDRPDSSCTVVDGVDHLEGRIFTVTGGSESISVFMDRAPFSRLGDIIADGREDVKDIVACRETGRLYVADNGVWAVTCARTARRSRSGSQRRM